MTINKSPKKDTLETTTGEPKEAAPPAPKYGPLPKVSRERIWSRGILILGVMVYVWYTAKDSKETSLAKQSEVFPKRGQALECDKDYLKDISAYPGCIPLKCGRYITDQLITANEVHILLNMAKKGINIAGSSGSASILDLHSGALSYGEKFINIYSLEQAKKIVSASDLAIYKMVKNKIQHAIAENFGLDVQSLHLTHPTFFSRFTSQSAKNKHDEYWNIHIDKVTYETFHYTSLLYLTDFNVDFKGGRFVFVDNIEKPTNNVTVEPRKGRVLMFTSGAENPHFVEPVTEGVRFAITVSFTCDKNAAIQDPSQH